MADTQSSVGAVMLECCCCAVRFWQFEAGNMKMLAMKIIRWVG